MLDLIVLSFQMDKTRIATLMLNNDLSQMNFGFIPGVEGALHLDLTHNGKSPELEAMYLKTNQFHIQQFAYIVDRMKHIDDGAGTTLLDNSIMLGGSNLFDGDSHGADQMPLLLAGKGGGTIEPGRVLAWHADLGVRLLVQAGKAGAAVMAGLDGDGAMADRALHRRGRPGVIGTVCLGALGCYVHRPSPPPTARDVRPCMTI